jgi:hypothetical protein
MWRIQEEVFPGKAVARGTPFAARDDLADGFFRLRRDPFVGIENKDPRLTAPVDGHLLLGAEALPELGEDVAAEVAGDLEGPVDAPRVDNDDLPCEGNALQTAGEICHGHLSDRPVHAGRGHHTTEAGRIKTMK